MKIEAGINKFKSSTIAEAEMTAAAGGRDVLLAYQPVGPNIQRLVQLILRFPGTQFSALVDNELSLLEISNQAKANHVNIPLYLDLNVGMNRTGIVAGMEAIRLYQQISQTSGVKAAGLHAYDGHLHESNPVQLANEAKVAFDGMWTMKRDLEIQGISVPNIVASGTPTSSLMAKYPGVEVGAGTTVLWDFGQPLTCPEMDFLNALVVVTRVISRPLPNRICVDLGHKAIASEMAHPRVKFFGLEDAVPVTHNEEHLVLETPRASFYPPGSVLYGLPKHVCPTVALHQSVAVVESHRLTDHWEVVGRARKITI